MTVEDVDGIGWDDEVDIVCAGPGPAPLAAATAADAAGLEVLLTATRAISGAETLAGRLGLTDESADYLDAVTEDTGPPVPTAAPAPLAVRRGSEPPWPELDPPVSFSGPGLRDWAVACLGSPYGLLCTSVAGADARAVGVIDPAAVADLNGWLADRARECDVYPAADTALGALVFAGGVVVGAGIDGPGGRSLVRTRGGVIVATGTGAALPPLRPAELAGAGVVQLVVRGRSFSRFARLELLGAD